VGFLARGKNLQELFAAAASALCEYGWQVNTVTPSETVRLRVRAATMEDLLFTWLSEVLFLADAEQWIFKNFKVSAVEQTMPSRDTQKGPPLWQIDGQAQGERFADKRHRARTYIKAVTYHQLSVKETKAGWQATVYLDV
jgi:SHS2 domain-containing protein